MSQNRQMAEVIPVEDRARGASAIEEIAERDGC